MMTSSHARWSPRRSGRGLNKVAAENAHLNHEVPSCAPPRLFAWVACGGKNLTPVRHCGLGGPHPGTSKFWRRLCQRLGHSGITKHAEMAAIAALPPEVLHPPRRRLVLVVVRLRPIGQPNTCGGRNSDDGCGSFSGFEFALSRPCDECAKIIYALGCFKRVIFCDESGALARASPEELLAVSQPCSGKRFQCRHAGKRRSLAPPSSGPAASSTRK